MSAAKPVALLAGLLALVTAAAGSVAITASNRIEAQAAAVAVDQERDLAEATAQVQVAQIALASAGKTQARLEAAVTARDGFDAKLTELKKALDAAPDSVDTTAVVDRVRKAQDAVTAAGVTASGISAATGELQAALDEVGKLVAEHEARLGAEAAARAAQTARPHATGGNSGAGGGGGSPAATNGGGTDWVGYARGILNSFGGGWVSLTWSDYPCGISPIACANGSGIQIGQGWVNMSDARKRWAIMHEYAHMIQFQHWSAIHASGTYQSLFGDNIEVLANCMASARGYSNHGHSCSGAMVAYGANVWRGIIG